MFVGLKIQLIEFECNFTVSWTPTSGLLLIILKFGLGFHLLLSSFWGDCSVKNHVCGKSHICIKEVFSSVWFSEWFSFVPRGERKALIPPTGSLEKYPALLCGHVLLPVTFQELLLSVNNHLPGDSPWLHLPWVSLETCRACEISGRRC